MVHAAVALTAAHAPHQRLNVAHSGLGFHTNDDVAQAEDKVPYARVAGPGKRHLRPHLERRGQQIAKPPDQRLLTLVPDRRTGRMQPERQLQSEQRRNLRHPHDPNGVQRGARLEARVLRL